MKQPPTTDQNNYGTPTTCIIVILNYNGWQDTIECLTSLAQADLGLSRVVLLDNGSSNESVTKIRKWNKSACFFAADVDLDATTPNAAPSGHLFLTSSTNHGFSRGNNLAYQAVARSEDTPVFLLNNDTVVQPDFLVHLLAFHALHPAAVLIPQIRLFDRPNYLWNCGGEIKWPLRRTYYYNNAPVFDLPDTAYLSITFTTGCAVLFTPSMHGYLDERFFFGEEDINFSWRQYKEGSKSYCLLSSVIYHKVSGSMDRSKKRMIGHTLNRLINIKCNLNLLGIACGFIFHLANFNRHIVAGSDRTNSIIKIARLNYNILLYTFNNNRVGKLFWTNFVMNNDITYIDFRADCNVE